MTEKNQQACDMLSLALDMEKKGKAFYDRSAGKCENRQVSKIFSMLADQEVEHIERINELYSSLTEGKGWCEIEYGQMKHGDLAAVFRQMAKKHGANVSAMTSDLEALDTGIGFEAESVKFYQERLAKADNDLEKKFLEQMVEEEKEHHAALSDLKLYLADPASWFREMEKTGLDGA